MLWKIDFFKTTQHSGLPGPAKIDIVCGIPVKEPVRQQEIDIGILPDKGYGFGRLICFCRIA